ncbi:uclacyanin 1-like [Syzygium oleosum]|uniref:uclacyanin 1-like n=1 Tax=Syzygium oleosum TaxID=219896 RepID=UPI0011D18B49|nr:uclacyanin 1-like [Syzygium oleosum]
MVSKMNMLVLMVFLGASIRCCSAQTTHVVGDSLGWVVPPGGAIAYSTWAANETFVVGDTLVFNFTTQEHDVAKVTKAAFDSCDSTSPISLQTDGPASIALNQSGEHFFICTIGQHCSRGQKLGINVSTASAPAPAPTTTPPPPPAASAPAPATTPTRSPVTYTVGENVGWNVLANTTQAYELWAANKTFMVGDILVFNFVNGTQNVAEITKSAFDSCNTTSPISVSTVPPVRITLTTLGEHFYTSTYPNRCSLGQKLAINVTGSSATTPSPSPTTTPSSPSPASTPTPSSPSPATPPSSTATPPSTSTSPPPPTTTTTPPTTSTTPPPPGNSAASLSVTGLFSGILSIAVVLLY